MQNGQNYGRGDGKMEEKLMQDKKKKEKKKYSKPRIIDQREFEREPLMACQAQCKAGPGGGAQIS